MSRRKYLQPLSACALAFMLAGLGHPPEKLDLSEAPLITGPRLQGRPSPILDVDVPELPNLGPNTRFMINHAGMLLKPDLLKGFAGTPVLKIDARSFLQEGEDGLGRPSRETSDAFKEWLQNNHAEIAARIVSEEGDATFENILEALLKRTGGIYLYGQERPRILFINLSPANEERLKSSDVLQIAYDIAALNTADKSIQILGQDYKPETLKFVFQMAQIHALYADSRIENFVSRSWITRPETAPQVFLTWYALRAGLDWDKDPAKFEVLAKKLKTAMETLAAVPEAQRVRKAKTMLYRNRGKGIEAAFARAWLGSRPRDILQRHNLTMMPDLGSYVTRMRDERARPAHKLAPRR